MIDLATATRLNQRLSEVFDRNSLPLPDLCCQLCQFLVENLPGVRVASLLFAHLKKREGLVCGVYAPNFGPVDMSGVLVMDDGQWSAADPRIQRGQCVEYTRQDHCNDHEILLEICQGADSFLTIPIVGQAEKHAEMHAASALSLTLVSCTGQFLGNSSSAMAGYQRLQTVLSLWICSSTILRDAMYCYHIYNARSLPELTYHVISYVSSRLQDKLGKTSIRNIALGLPVETGPLKRISMFRIATKQDGAVEASRDQSSVLDDEGRSIVVRNRAIKMQGSVLQHFSDIAPDAADHWIPNFVGVVTGSRGIHGQDVLELVRPGHNEAGCISLWRHEDCTMFALYVVFERAISQAAYVSLMQSMRAFVLELFMGCVRHVGFEYESLQSGNLASLLSSHFSSLNSGIVSLRHLRQGGEAVPDLVGTTMTEALNDRAGPGPWPQVGSQSAADDSNISSTAADLSGQLRALVWQRTLDAMITTSAQNEVNEIDFRQEIGRGGYSRVYSAMWRGYLVAVKVTKLDSDTAAQTIGVGVATDVAILKSANHINVPRLYHALHNIPLSRVLSCMRDAHLRQRAMQALQRDPASGGNDRCCIMIMELCATGSLSRSLRTGAFVLRYKHYNQPAQRPNMYAILFVCLDVAHALERLHEMGIIHCDLKPGNLLVTQSKDRQCGVLVKVNDFGLSKILPPGKSHIANSNIGGTIGWAAPECIVPNGMVSTAIDIFSLGIMMWNLVTGEVMFDGSPEDIARSILNGGRPQFPPGTDFRFVVLAESCWNHRPQDRPTAKQVVQELTKMISALESMWGSKDGPASNRAR